VESKDKTRSAVFLCD
jgi:hypothetical protein